MKLIYIDESGNTGLKKDPDQPLHLIAAVIVDEAQVRPVEIALERLVERLFPSLCDLPDFELHGAELFKGEGLFKGIAPDTRVSAVNEVLDVLRAHDVRVGWAAVDKMQLFSARHPHQVAFLLLMEKLESYLQTAGALGLIIADENKEVEQKLIDDLKRFKRNNTGFGWKPMNISRVVDSVHFVRSHNNQLIQCADLVAYFSLRARRVRRMVDERARAQNSSSAPTLDAESITRSEKAVLQIDAALASIRTFTKLFP